MTHRNLERGNVLFYILIAIALLAALSFAIAQSSRGNVQQLSKERAGLIATELLEYANVMTNAVSQLRLRGVTPAELCFDDPSWPAGQDYNHAGCADPGNKIFGPEGGAMIWQGVSADATDSSASPDLLWHIYGNNEISEVGTTCGAAGCADLVLITNELNLSVCQQINTLLGLAGPNDTPPTDAAFGSTRYVGVFAYTNTIGDEAGGAVIKGKNAGCFEKTGVGANYVFYKVLMAR